MRSINMKKTMGISAGFVLAVVAIITGSYMVFDRYAVQSPIVFQSPLVARKAVVVTKTVKVMVTPTPEEQASAEENSVVGTAKK